MGYGLFANQEFLFNGVSHKAVNMDKLTKRFTSGRYTGATLQVAVFEGRQKLQAVWWMDAGSDIWTGCPKEIDDALQLWEKSDYDMNPVEFVARVFHA